MFQNINEDTIEENKKVSNINQKFKILRQVFEKENIVLYIVAFMLSLVSLDGEPGIFSISMLGACFASSVPLLGVVIVTLIGTGIKLGIEGAIRYLINTIVLIVSLFIFKPRFNENEKNENIKIGKNIVISIISIRVVKMLITSFTIYDILTAIAVSIIALVFYKIFVNSIVVLQEVNKKRAFSIEEVIGASVLLSIAAGGFGTVSIFGLSICNIISILIVMILGWKNGILVGTTSGVTIGITLGVIMQTEPIMIAAYAISGMLAGILNRFGKFGVVAGFALGNVVLAYVSNGYTTELIYFKEILVASIGLLAVPKALQINLEEFIGKNNYLPIVPGRALNNSKDVANSLSNVSEAIQDMATTYKIPEDKKMEYFSNKQIFISELLNNIEPYKDNILYDDVANTEGEVINKIFEYLLDKQEIDNKSLVKIFENCNSYIVGCDDDDIRKQLENSISQIVREINLSYKVSKTNFIWNKKVQEHQKNMEKQLNEVSKAINSVVKTIEKNIEQEVSFEKQRKKILELLNEKGIEIEDISISKKGRFIVEIYLSEETEIGKTEQIAEVLSKILKEKISLNTEKMQKNKLSYLSDDKYEMAVGQVKSTKSKSEVSGDNILTVRLNDGKYLVAISDGMGTGREANNSSTKALKMLEELLESGFDKKASLDLINTSLMSQQNETFATLDIAIIDLYLGNIEFIKNGACPTYIKNKKKVQIVKANSLPTGIVDLGELQIFDKDINDGDIMLMCTDGVIDSNIEYKNKELWLKYMLEDIETTNTQKIADLLMNEAIDNNFGIPKDDMSILICKFRKK